MKLIMGILTGVLVVVSSVNRGVVADSMHGSAMMPKCWAGDAMVVVNTKTKMYMPPDKSHMMMSGSHGGGAMSNNDMLKSDMKTMCKSKADAMGAHMMKGKGQM